jgi:hypothetical protein
MIVRSSCQVPDTGSRKNQITGSGFEYLLKHVPAFHSKRPLDKPGNR